MIFIAAVTVAGIAGLFAACGGSSDERNSSNDANLPGLENFGPQTNQHVSGRVQYPQTPPVGGNHDPVWQDCGFYSRPIVTERGVHTLEHGAVWITYRPDLPIEQVQQLRQLATSTTYILVSPWPDLPAPLVATAWRHQLRLDSVNDPRLTDFINRFRGGSDAPEPGAACTGGSTATVG